MILFVAGAAALGLKRPARYTATANLSVGHVYVDNPAGIPSIIIATQSLASAYSRAINSSAVVEETKRRIGRPASPLSGTLSATPIPDSPLIRVSAESSSERGAVTLANAAAAALAAYTNRQVRDNEASVTLADRYRRAALAYRRRVDARNQLERQYEREPTPAHKAARDDAAAAADTALLRRDALRASYQTAVQGGTSSIAVEMFSRASTSESDRIRMLQILLFVGLIGGLSAGAALALLRAARRIRRRGAR